MKRLFDIMLSVAALICLSPIMLVVAIFIQIKIGENIFFIQDRPGLNGKIFKMFKFRTMSEKVDQFGKLLPDNKRLSSSGVKLRSMSLDELPGLWNVLKGDMSLVGPRPLLVEYLPLYNKEQAKRHNVRPGITGWAQINGRNSLSWEQKFELDVWYVNNQNFWLDFKILLLTVKKVLVREGISADGHVTIDKFKGSH